MQFLDDISNFFVSSAHADTGSAAAGGGYNMIIMFAVFILFMYFGIFRPQNKKAREQRDLLGSLKEGDEVMTAGGIVGKIAKLNDNFVVLFLNDNVQITMQKSSIVNALPKGTLKSL